MAGLKKKRQDRGIRSSLKILLLREQVDPVSRLPFGEARFALLRQSLCAFLPLPPSFFLKARSRSTTRGGANRPLPTNVSTLIVRSRSLGKVVYPSSFNYLINSVSSIIFARVIKPPTKVNNLWRGSNSRSWVR